MASAVIFIRQNTNRTRQIAACKRSFRIFYCLLLFIRLDFLQESRMIMLNFLPLEFRRQMKDLIFLFKLKNGLYNLDCEEYAENVQTNPNLVII